MLKQIASTTLSRIVITLIGFAILLLNTRILGAEKLGELALYLVALNLIIQVGEIVGGASLVYLFKKYPIMQLLLASYAWVLIVSTIALFVLQYWIPISDELALILVAAAFIQSLSHVNLHLLVGMEKINRYNYSTLSQSLFMIVGLLVLYFGLESNSLRDYLLVYLVSQIGLFLFSTAYLPRLKNSIPEPPEKSLLREIFSYGFVIQLANVFQFGVYRLNYLILEFFSDKATLGVFSIGNQIGEKALIPGKAMSLVQYSKISNQDDLEASADLTLKLLNLNKVVTAAAVLVLIILPGSLLEWILGPGFEEVRIVFLYLGPGFVFLGISSIFSHFFAGLGKYHYNTLTSCMGLVGMAGLAFWMIPIWGIQGAAISSSIVYFFQALIQAFIFQRVSKMSWKNIVKTFFRSYQKYTLGQIRRILKP